ncbi:MAG: hypothetical protein M1835_003669 [Candelina submexicana]|nr:MAG: hypothetical protein M1835_003669 [Candelina submexicana]
MDPQRGRLLSQDSFPPRSSNSSSSLHESLVMTMRHSRSTNSSSSPSPYYIQSRQNSFSIEQSTDYSEAISDIQCCSSHTALPGLSASAQAAYDYSRTRSESDGEIVGGIDAMAAQLKKERSLSIVHALRCITPFPVDVQREESDRGKRRKLKNVKVKEARPKMRDLGHYLPENKEVRKQKKGIDRVKATWWKAREWIVWGT